MSSSELGAKDLGTKVNYIRYNAEDKIEKGVGVLVSLAVDPTGHIIGIVRKGQKSFNIDLVAINATEEAGAAYAEKVQAIRAKAQAANADIRAITDAANAEIKVLQNECVGEPLVLPEVEEDAPAESPAGEQVAA